MIETLTTTVSSFFLILKNYQRLQLKDKHLCVQKKQNMLPESEIVGLALKSPHSQLGHTQEYFGYSDVITHWLYKWWLPKVGPTPSLKSTTPFDESLFWFLPLPSFYICRHNNLRIPMVITYKNDRFKGKINGILNNINFDYKFHFISRSD